MADAWATFKTTRKRNSTRESAPAPTRSARASFSTATISPAVSGAVLGIYGNSKDEAIYPVYFVDSDKKPLSGANRYELRFAPGDLPPVNAFWSLTLYELPSSLLSANPLNRYLINSPMLPSLKRDDDGGVTLAIQHADPGADEQANWLPAPTGPFFAGHAPLLAEGRRAQRAMEGASARSVAERHEAARLRPAAVPVTPDNFVRAESDRYFGNLVKEGGFGKLFHRREPAAIDNQTVIRLNRDTLYSSAVFDLDAGPVTITLPDAGKRFMSMQVIDEDEYTPMVRLRRRKPHAAPRRRSARATSWSPSGRWSIPTTRRTSRPSTRCRTRSRSTSRAARASSRCRTGTRRARRRCATRCSRWRATLPDTKGMFGPQGEVDPVRHLIGAASAWGGNPEKDALYLNVTPAQNDGKTIYS